jgi:hypothetical protein
MVFSADFAENVFKLFFALIVVVACLTVIGFFLLGIKVALLFSPQIQILGINFS